MSVTSRMLAASTPNSVPDMTTEPNAAVAPRHRAVWRIHTAPTQALPTGGPLLGHPALRFLTTHPFVRLLSNQRRCALRCLTPQGRPG
jgi:hypothetical protein